MSNDTDKVSGAALRVPPLADDQWPQSIVDLKNGFAGDLNVYRLMARHPALLRAWEAFRNHIVTDSRLSPREREIVVLRVGHRWQSSYEWGHHVVRGRQAGLTEQQILAARREPADTLLMSAVDALLDMGAMGPEMAVDLEAAIGQEAVFDLIATVGMYTTLAFFVKTFHTPLEPHIAALLERDRDVSPCDEADVCACPAR